MKIKRQELLNGLRDRDGVGSRIVMITAVILCLMFKGSWAAEVQSAAATAETAIGAANDQPRAVVTIDANKPMMPFSPFIFGGFLEHFDHQIYNGIFEPGSPLSNEKGFRLDVIAAMKEIRLSIVRWPGGCFASAYHWKDGVGKNRKPVYDIVWGVEDSNLFGTCEFVEWCRQVGCEPYICTNAGNGAPQEMKDWVEYCNGTQGEMAQMRMADYSQAPLNVRYWSIGNENWGGHEVGARTPEQWGPLVRQSAELMRSVDPQLQLLAAATSNSGWTLPLLEKAGNQLQYVAIHNYWLGLWGENRTPDYLTCIMESDGPEKLIGECIGLLEKAGYRGRIKIAFDEWNLRGWHHPGFPRKEPSDNNDKEVIALIKNRDKNDIPSQYSMADALFSASFLNACLRHADDVGMTNIAPIVNTRGPLYVHSKGLVKRTTFHVLSMYANELKGLVVKTEVDAGMLRQGERSVAVVDAIATVDETKTSWTVALVNRHPEKAAACTLAMAGVTLEGNYEAVVLAGDSPEAYNDIESPNRVVPRKTQLAIKNGTFMLEPHSLTMVKVSVKK